MSYRQTVGSRWRQEVLEAVSGIHEVDCTCKSLVTFVAGEIDTGWVHEGGRRSSKQRGQAQNSFNGCGDTKGHGEGLGTLDRMRSTVREGWWLS